MSRAQKEAFHMVKETCPAIDSALSDLETIIKQQTSALRDSLIEAIERAIDAETKLENAEDKIEKLEQEIDALEAQL